MTLIDRLDSLLGKLASWLLVGLLGLMVLMGFTQVLLRNLFSGGIIWADIFLRHVVLWIAFLGAIVAVGERRHITIDALTKVLSPLYKKIASIVTNLSSVIVGYFLTAASFRFLRDEIEFGGTLFLDIPIWLFQVIIPVGFGIITIRFFVQLIQSARSLIIPVEDDHD